MSIEEFSDLLEIATAYLEGSVTFSEAAEHLDVISEAVEDADKAYQAMQSIRAVGLRDDNKALLDLADTLESIFIRISETFEGAQSTFGELIGIEKQLAEMEAKPIRTKQQLEAVQSRLAAVNSTVEKEQYGPYHGEPLS